MEDAGDPVSRPPVPSRKSKTRRKTRQKSGRRTNEIVAIEPALLAVINEVLQQPDGGGEVTPLGKMAAVASVLEAEDLTTLSAVNLLNADEMKELRSALRLGAQLTLGQWAKLRTALRAATEAVPADPSAVRGSGSGSRRRRRRHSMLGVLMHYARVSCGGDLVIPFVFQPGYMHAAIRTHSGQDLQNVLMGICEVES